MKQENNSTIEYLTTGELFYKKEWNTISIEANDKPRIYAYIGVMGSGKNHRYEMARKPGDRRIDFADAVRDIASSILGYDIRKDYDIFKKKMLWKNGENQYTGRDLLQRIGEECFRKQDENYWCREWKRKARLFWLENKENDIYVTDLRYENEARELKWFAETNGYELVIILCNYKSNRYNSNNNHESEKLAQKLIKLGCCDGEDITDKLDRSMGE